MQPNNSHHLVAAAHRRSCATMERAETALTTAERSGVGMSVAELARTAGVSRAWLYAQPELRNRITQLAGKSRTRPPNAGTPVPVEQRATTASAHTRLEIALARNRKLAAENVELREQLARSLGDARAGRVR